MDIKEYLLGQECARSEGQGMMDTVARCEKQRLAITTMGESGISTSIPIVRNIDKFDEEDEHVSTSKEKKKMNEKKRVVMKGGSTSVTYKNISKKRRRYFSDLYTTLLDSSWSYCVLMFMASFYFSWLLFGIIYFLICYIHGDFLPDNLDNSDFVPCIEAVDGFSSAFLFSLETQHTIGYGTRMPTTECYDAQLSVSLQAVLGCLIQAFMVGLVFSKLSRPQLRTKTVIFSQRAVITLRDRKLCLIFRIGDLRDDNFVLGTQISAKLMRRKVTEEGEIYQDMKMLKISPDSANEPCIFFVWPLEIVHTIDEESPLYDMSAADLARERFEIVVIMEGTIETSSMTFQARSSYLPGEVLWGHRFEQMLLYRKDHNKFQVNFAAFHSTFQVETPQCSARELGEWYSHRERTYKLHMMNNLGHDLTHVLKQLPEESIESETTEE